MNAHLMNMLITGYSSNEKDWATPTIKESPFWRDGMTPEEYEKEREYYYNHIGEIDRSKPYKTLKERGIAYA